MDRSSGVKATTLNFPRYSDIPLTCLFPIHRRRPPFSRHKRRVRGTPADINEALISDLLLSRRIISLVLEVLKDLSVDSRWIASSKFVFP